ncbi:MAG: leucine-rich repeat protein, partial [Lachnospiraceae bacterium]|nr:leucine-rich repeat protein [Lachnospiraceae bacterium]
LNEHIVIVVDRGSYAEEFFRNYETNSEFYPHRHLPVRYRGEMNDEPDEDYEEIFEYTISDDGTVHIDEILVGGDVVIPSKIHGCPVTEVNCSLSETTNSITFPDADIFLSGIDDDSTDDGWEEKIFDNYFHLDRLVLPEKSTRYRTDGFAVFSADLKKLYKFYSGETGYTVPEGTERICTGAFAGSKIEEVDLPDSLKEIGNCAFGNCRNFRRINGGRNLISVSGYFAYMAPFKIDDEMILGKTLVNAAIKEKSYHIPEGVETISAEAFEDSEGLEEIYLPASLKTIEDHAFGVKLTHLKNIYAPDGCGNFVSIDGALYSNDLKELYYVPYDYNISTLSIHHLVKRIHNCAIHNAHVTRLEFEGVVEDFGRTAVYACEKLEEVIFADGQKNLVGKDIDGILSRCPNISKIHLPKKLEVIGRDFCMDASIREIDFPKKLKEIGDCAFRSNPIEYLTLPRSLKTVGDSAFGGALKRVTLYDNLQPNTRYRKERRTSGYQIECQSSIPLLSLNYNQKNPI